MIIESRAPTRIDLAGGTIDIWPLYLFHPRAATVNCAIDVYAHCRIETRRDKKFLLRSIDGRREVLISRFEDLATDATLPLLAKLIYSFRPRAGLTMTTDCTAPEGSGLGGSSALNIAICGALHRLTGERFDKMQLQNIARNVEAQVIQVPTGEQDYFPPLFGGVLCLHFSERGVTVERLAIDPQQLQSRLVLCYTGKPRYSGTNNWQIMKAHINGDQAIFQKFENIRDTVLEMRAAIQRQDFRAMSAALDREWKNRKQLAPRVSTSVMESQVSAARRAGATAAKVCGAGGGGCMVFFVREGQKKKVEHALTQAGGRVLPFRIVSSGLTVNVH